MLSIVLYNLWCNGLIYPFIVTIRAVPPVDQGLGIAFTLRAHVFLHVQHMLGSVLWTSDAGCTSLNTGARSFVNEQGGAHQHPRW